MMELRNSDKTLLILDLDETLVHASEEKLDRSSDCELFGYHIYERPFLREFLAEMSELYLLGIWSSASDDYVELLVNNLFASSYNLEFVWGRSRCTYKRNMVEEMSRNAPPYHYVKPLKKLKRHGYSLDRILILDDSPHKCRENYGNAIYPLEYKGDSKDDELQKLIPYLQRLSNEKDVRKIEKRGWRMKSV